MKRPWLAPLLVFVAFGWLAAEATAKEKIALVVDAPLSGAAKLALEDFERAINGRYVPTWRKSLGDEPRSVVVGVSGASPTVDKLLAAYEIDLSKKAESLCIRWISLQKRQVLLLVGRDTRGLSYALLEAARAVELSPAEEDALGNIRDAIESPFVRVRNISVHPLNADVDAEWYFSERFWREYFAQLARNRFNTFTLTYCDQTNYLNPPYAYLVDVPGFEQVQVQGQNARDRQRNLAMLGRIAELAQERALDFTLGIWMQAPVPRYSGKVLAKNLPEGPAAAEYCAKGLGMILKACPAIKGLQLRMNDEAGVPPEQQTEFHRPMFRVLSECGRPIRLDLRYKGLMPETIQVARNLGLDVTVSTKFWCEHFGLPYHPTSADTHYRESRYGFGAMLAQPRPYHVAYQLWTVGSQRLLLWGDPGYAARFARSCQLGGGDAFEVFAPLTDKGYGNAPGTWRIFKDRSYEVGEWEYERYWAFYLAFGRWSYNPDTATDVWTRELQHRFGKAAEDIGAAYRQASQIIPLITATRLAGASEWSWWPEMDTGGALAEYIRTQPSDPAQFYAIRSWQRTPNWRWEDWDATPGYVDDAVAGRVRGKTTPMDVSDRLRGLAEESNKALDRARSQFGDPKAAEVKSTELDLRVLAQLGLYHSAKTVAATHLAFFEATGEAGRLPEALKHMQAAAGAWQRIVELTDGVYHDNLVFGVAPDSPRSKLGHHHSGHWKDRLAEVQRDVAYLQDLVKKHGAIKKPYRQFPGEAHRELDLQVEHTLPETATPNVDLLITAKILNHPSPRQVVLHYRPLDQTADWKEVTMRLSENGRYEAIVPGRDIRERFDLQYYLEIQTADGGELWPSWTKGQPYVIVRVKRP